MAGPTKIFTPIAEKGKPAVVSAFLNNAFGNHFALVAQDGDATNLTRENLRLVYPGDRQGDKISLANDKITDIRTGGAAGDFQIDFADGKGRKNTLTHLATQGKYQLEGTDIIPLTRLKPAAEFGGKYPDEKTEKRNRIPVTLATGLEQAGIQHGLTCDIRTERNTQLRCPPPVSN